VLSIQKRSKFIKNERAVYIRKVREVTRALSIQKMSKFVKNVHARYTLERYER
jgi:hypothetical protein